MDKSVTLVLAGGIIIALILTLVSIYLAGIVFIIILVIAMSLMIMKDSAVLPEIAVRLKEDAKGIILTNPGNSGARNIHVAVIPLDIEYDIASLAVDASHEYPLPNMAGEIKVVLRYENEQGDTFTGTFRLSSMAPEYDPLKPMFPLFGWKK